MIKTPKWGEKHGAGYSDSTPKYQAKLDRKQADIKSDYAKAISKGKNKSVADAKMAQRMADSKDDYNKWTGGDRTESKAAHKAAQGSLSRARKGKPDVTVKAPAAKKAPMRVSAPSQVAKSEVTASKASPTAVKIPKVAPTQARRKAPAKAATPAAKPKAPTKVAAKVAAKPVFTKVQNTDPRTGRKVPNRASSGNRPLATPTKKTKPPAAKKAPTKQKKHASTMVVAKDSPAARFFGKSPKPKAKATVKKKASARQRKPNRK